MSQTVESAHEPSENTEATRERTVLLVEDDSALRIILHNGLEMQGFTVLEANSKKPALEMIKAHPEIGVIILDLGLPPKEHNTEEGLDVIKNVTSELLTAKIVVLTGQDEEKSALDAIREGAFDFLAKPAEFDSILSAVNRAFLFFHKEQDLSADGTTRLQLNAKVSDGLKAVREEAEEKLVRKVLKDTGFNVYQSASKLGLKRESVYYFMKKFGIQRDDH